MTGASRPSRRRVTYGQHDKARSRLKPFSAAKLVEAPGIESPVTYAPIVAQSGGKEASDATLDDAERREVSACRGGSGPVTRADADAAIWAAAKTAIDAADYPRARALIDLLDTKRSASPRRWGECLPDHEPCPGPPRFRCRAWRPHCRGCADRRRVARGASSRCRHSGPLHKGDRRRAQGSACPQLSRRALEFAIEASRLGCLRQRASSTR
jgi:hypothetical protein